MSASKAPFPIELPEMLTSWCAWPGRFAVWDDRLLPVPLEELVAEGRAALRAGDAPGARGVFEGALAVLACGDVIEGLARASYLEFEFVKAIEDPERAYAAHRERGDVLGAVRVARMPAYVYGTVVGDRALWPVGLLALERWFGTGPSRWRAVG